MSQTSCRVELIPFDRNDGTVRQGPPGSIADPYITLSELLRYHFQELANEDAQRSFGVHVTHAASAYGDQCDRALHYQLQRMPRDAGKVSGFNQDKMQRRFALGHAFHDIVYNNLEKALTRHMESRSDDLVLVGWDVEQSFSLPNGLTGTPDLVVHYKWGDGPVWSVVYDVKSVTRKSLQEYARGSGVQAPQHYQRQIQIYIDVIPTAVSGQILWVETEFPYLMHDSPVPANRSVYKRLEARLAEIEQAECAGRLSLANVGKHCSSCPYESTCMAARAGE